MLTIGITGGIGSGKSTFCAVIRAFGHPVYDADTHAKHLMHTDPQLRAQLQTHFGTHVYGPDGTLQRAVLASQVFNNPEALQRLNQCVHPRVEEHFRQWCTEQAAHPWLFKESALLFETGLYQQLDVSVLVLAPVELRMQRLLQRDSVGPEAIRARMANQWTDDQKRPLAHFLVHNDDQQLLFRQAIQLFQFLAQWPNGQANVR